ncbi:MAG: hypothetical protein KGK07_14400 [Chloroflexota bacterium]|nr:hypothetical protein [Chloroflexota bacterium]
MTFAEALEQMHAGRRVRRPSWPSGAVAFVPDLPSYDAPYIAYQEDFGAHGGAVVRKRWPNASEDVLATDWTLAEEPAPPASVNQTLLAAARALVDRFSLRTLDALRDAVKAAEQTPAGVPLRADNPASVRALAKFLLDNGAPRGLAWEHTVDDFEPFALTLLHWCAHLETPMLDQLYSLAQRSAEPPGSFASVLPALRAGKSVRRRGWQVGWYIDGRGAWCPLPSDLLANDWEAVP